MPQIAKIAVEAATYAIDKPYSYVVPSGMDAAVGCRVLVPFGRGNRPSEGMILSLEEAVPEKPLKSVRLLLDEEPLVSQKEIKLALWMMKRYFCTFYDAMRTILPAAVWYHYRETWCLTGNDLTGLGEKELAVCEVLSGGTAELDKLTKQFGEGVIQILHSLQKKGIVQENTESRRKVQDKNVTLAVLAVDREAALCQIAPRRKAAREAVQFLAQYGETTVQELCYYTGVSRQSVNLLEKAGIVILREQETYRISDKQYAIQATPIVLNDEQQQVYDEVLAEIRAGKPGVTLLQGVTGSGKTLVYIRLAQALLEENKSVMILVPEIALTPQMMARFGAYFGDEVALLHSGLRMTERYDQWKRIRKGEAHIVLGTRSAVFAPLENIALIVMDEEQENSYESEKAPCYHARDIAKYRAAAENARLLLGSATPTVETAWYAKNGDYQLALLRKRYNEQKLPRVILADMRKELEDGNPSAISRELYEELKENIAKGEQSILFLNRRGASRQLLCPNCGYVPQCPRCSVYLTYHSANRRLMCHYCGYSEQAAERCPDCGGTMKHIGIGTQKIAEELQELFPDTKVLRMDADTVTAGHEAILKQFAEENVPILLGTQMVAKGLDFENVTLVGVLAADLSLYVDHYRAAERTFSLLTQVVGRAGRGEKAGRAVIQTYTPKNDVILSAAEQDYERFYEKEIRLRKLRQEPPFADLFTVSITGPEESSVRRSAKELCQALRAETEKPPFTDVEVLGPAPYTILKVNNRYRYRITVVGRNEKKLRQLLAGYMKAFAQRSENRNLGIFTDCNLMD